MCAKLWGKSFHRKKIQMQCDNTTTVHCINSGSSRNEMIQCCLRELHKLMGWHNFQIKLSYLEGEKNEISDALSRWYLNPYFKTLFEEHTKGVTKKQYTIKDEFFEFLFL